MKHSQSSLIGKHLSSYQIARDFISVIDALFTNFTQGKVHIDANIYETVFQVLFYFFTNLFKYIRDINLLSISQL